MDWYPAPDEDLLLRTTAKFATGVAPAVSGCRWFRDPERKDIQGELSGWPSGPAFTLRTTGDQAARRTGRAFLVGIPLIANLIANIGGAAGSPFGDVPVRGKPEEPENEVRDFPVMWAASGALARTVPWQLDPGRRPEGYVTDLALTSRRLLFLGVRSGTLDKADVLGEFPRESIATARQMKFSEIGADVRITFADQSWIRLFTGNPDSAERLAELLTGTVQMLPESALSEGQRQRVTRFMADLPDTAQPPAYTKLASGIVMVEARVPAKAGTDLFETHSILMDASGAPAQPEPGDL
ncbi:hypothetical protein [Streptomyces sporangiiformans]|uniref:Uncharacterized protein n=1 Tax=Streptomyces sporangiiformans TaxID=2315329 RepID=A0A505DC02_9ACTN|nr:hypothetical protein [Streptomyces sporangiiformans]TPQ22063.1 hypothetical protein FGD71_011755 [Streptomyces sporangiiformans]